MNGQSGMSDGNGIGIGNGKGCGNGTRVYFAAPLFCEAEKAWNLRVTSVLEEAGYSVFLPQRDGMLAAEFAGKSEADTVGMIFRKDVSELWNADVLVFVPDGRTPDEGACVELGIAFASGKRCYCVRSDVRALEKDLTLNPLVAGCFLRIFEDPDGEALLASLREYLRGNAL